MEANKEGIYDIVGKKILRIPFFQRKYVWEDDMWEEFLDTMQDISSKDHKDDYFMGSIIVKKNDTRNRDDESHEIDSVIDGQQRLITLFLFFKVLCDKKNIQKHFKDKFFVRDIHMNPSICLETSKEDKEVFNKIIENKIKVAENESSNPYNNSKIYRCYKFFADSDLKSVDIEKIRDFVRFVVIKLEENEDEQQVFDTINSLGVMLTTAELVKNYLFKNNKEGTKEYEDYWQKTFEDDATFWEHNITSGRQKKTNIDLFFQAFFDVYVAIYNKKYKDKVKERFAPRAGSLSKDYKDFFAKIGIEKNRNVRINFLESLKDYACVYEKNINKNLIKESIESNIGKINVIIFLINTTAFVSYILYIIKNSPDEDRDKMFGLIVNYIMRRIVCRSSTKSYANIFNKLIGEDCNTYKKLNKWMYETREPTNSFPSDEELGEGFLENKISNNNAKIIVYFIEKFLRRNEKYTLTLRSIYKYEIEHVLPKKWEKNWGHGLSEVEKYRRNEHVNKIGNFTLVTKPLNKSLTNADWDTKKGGNEKGKGLEEYSKGLKTFDKYMQEKDWNEEVIDKRSDFLYETGKKVWPLPLKQSEIK